MRKENAGSISGDLMWKKGSGAERSIICVQAGGSILIMCASRIFNFVKYMSIICRCPMCVERRMINIQYMHVALRSCNVLLMCDLKSKYDSTPQSNVEAMCSKFVNWFVFNTMHCRLSP